jgi:hypothetical protein
LDYDEDTRIPSGSDASGGAGDEGRNERTRGKQADALESGGEKFATGVEKH